MKRLVSLSLCGILLAGCLAMPASAASKLTVGQTLKMGTYEQDNDTCNGPEDIEWIVLDVDGTKALLISKYCLDAAKYHNEKVDTTWAECDLRDWLNDDFLDEAFTSSEQKQILDTEITTPVSVYGNKTGGCDTVDKIFCLSIDEAQKYFSSNRDRKASRTKYAASRTPYSWWWLRSPGGANNAAKAIVNDKGKVTTGGNWVTNNDSVRPAMWVDTSK